MEKFIHDYCLSKVGAHHNFKEEWEADRYLIKDKMFVMIGENKEGTRICTIKLKPENGDFLRTTFPNQVTPGYYMNKVHWNSISLKNPLKKDLIQKLLDESYKLIFESFSKKMQAQIIDGE